MAGGQGASDLAFLRRKAETMRRIMNTVEMPDRMAENRVRFIRMNEGKLGRKRRDGEFEKLASMKWPPSRPACGKCLTGTRAIRLKCAQCVARTDQPVHLTLQYLSPDNVPITTIATLPSAERRARHSFHRSRRNCSLQTVFRLGGLGRGQGSTCISGPVPGCSWSVARSDHATRAR